MQAKFWKYFAYGFALLQTLCAALLVEFIIFGKPFISLFCIILAFTLHFNFKRYPNVPLARYWPFLPASK